MSIQIERIFGGTKDQTNSYKIAAVLHQPLYDLVTAPDANGKPVIDTALQADTSFGYVELLGSAKPNAYYSLGEDFWQVENMGFFKYINDLFDALGGVKSTNIFDFATDKQTVFNVDEILSPTVGANLERIVLRLHEVENLSIRGVVDSALTSTDTVTLNIYYFNIGKRDTDVNINTWTLGNFGVPFAITDPHTFIYAETVVLTPGDVVVNTTDKFTDWQKLSFLQDNRVTDIVITQNTTPASGTIKLQVKVDDYFGFVYSPYKIGLDNPLMPPAYLDAGAAY